MSANVNVTAVIGNIVTDCPSSLPWVGAIPFVHLPPTFIAPKIARDKLYNHTLQNMEAVR